MPKTIRIRGSSLRPLNWHACYSANFRKYRYTIYNGRSQNLFLNKWSWHKYRYRLDDELMNNASKGLIGFHDFRAFQKLGSNRPNSFTTIQTIEIKRVGDLVTLDIKASGFLYGMVRLLVGQLISIGEHRLSLDAFERRWKKQLREEVKESAPARGLCFIEAGYDEKVFSEKLGIDSFPNFLLRNSDPPPFPE